MLIIKKCEICDEEFSASRKDIKCCSKECKKKYGKEWKENNKEKVKEYDKRTKEKNKEKIKKKAKIRFKIWSENNQDKIKQNYKKNYKKIRKRQKQRLKDSPALRIHDSISSSMRKSLKANNISKGGRPWEKIVGYTTQELCNHLESLFSPGMNWNNYGRYGWHIDHILPKSYFKWSSIKDVEFRYCWSLNNLQPLWAKDNLSKNKKIFKKEEGIQK